MSHYSNSDRITHGGARLLAAVTLAATAVVPAGHSFGQTITNHWDAGSDGNWNLATNWSLDEVPSDDPLGERHYAYINSGHTVTIDSTVPTPRGLYVSEATSGAPVTPGSKLVVTTGGTLIADWVIRISGGGTIDVNGGHLEVDGNAYSFAVGDTGTGTVMLNVSAGSVVTDNFRIGHGTNGNSVVNLSGTGQLTGRMYLGGASPGEVNQSGGVWTGGSHYFGDGSTATYNLSGGELRSTGRLRIGHSSDATITMTGGTLNATHYPVLLGSDAGSGNGLLAISGGTVTMNSGMYVGNSSGAGTGTLRITGADATFIIDDTGNEDAALDVHANGTLEFQIGSTGVSTIMLNVSTTSSAGGSLLAGTLDIDLLPGFTPTVGQTFDLVSTASTYSGTTGGTFTNGFDITGLSLAAEDQPYWTYAVVTEGDRNILRLTNTGVIPEPASLALLGLGGALMLARRRQT